MYSFIQKLYKAPLQDLALHIKRSYVTYMYIGPVFRGVFKGAVWVQTLST